MGKQRSMKILRESEENICHGWYMLVDMVDDRNRRDRSQIKRANRKGTASLLDCTARGEIFVLEMKYVRCN